MSRARDVKDVKSLALVAADEFGMEIMPDDVRARVGELLLQVYMQVDREDPLAGVEARVGIATVRLASQAKNPLDAARGVLECMQYVREIVERARCGRAAVVVSDPLSSDLTREGL